MPFKDPELRRIRQELTRARRTGRPQSLVTALAAALLYTVAALAAEPVSVRPATTYMGTIKLEQHRAVELECRFAVSRVSVGDPDVADIDLTGPEPRTLRIIGKTPGRTNLIVWYGDGTVRGSGPGHEYELLVDGGYRVEVIKGTATDPEASLKGW